MGESELMLDGLSVEETLRIIGAKATSAPTAASPSRPDVGAHTVRETAVRETPVRETPVRETPLADPPRAGAEPGDAADWRATLRASSQAPALATPPSTTPAIPSPLSDVPAGLTVGGPTDIQLGGSMAHLESLEAVAAHVASCTRCPLHSTALNAVPGEGNAHAGLMCVGEAPGATEDETGRPFIGAAGQLLTKILEAIALGRDDVYIANVLKHRPPGNRNPRPEEVTACSPYLIRQIELIQPKVILALGTFAAQTLLNTKLTIGKLRGQIHHYYGVPLIVTYHPAALLRNPSWKRPTWEDVQLARRILDRPNPRHGRDPYRDRRPPYCEDAEQAVSSAMLIDQDAVSARPSAWTTQCSMPSDIGECSAPWSRSPSAVAWSIRSLSRRSCLESGELDDGRRQGLHRLPRRCGAHRGERRVSRQDRERESDSAAPHRGVHLDRQRSVRGQADGSRAARHAESEDLPGGPAADARRLHADQGAALADHGAHRGAAAGRTRRLPASPAASRISTS